MSQGSFPETIKRTAADVGRLARLQAELAKERVQRQAKRKAIFAGMVGGGAFFLLYALLFFLATAAAGLAIVLPVWLALLIVGGGTLVLAALMAGIGAVGLRGSRKPAAVEKATEEEEVEWPPAKSS